MRKFLLLIAMALSAAVSYADDVTVRVEGPTIARIDEYFNVQFIVDAEPDSYSEPDFGGLDLVAGPITSLSRSMSWINGKASNTVSYIITYSLIASKEGVYTIGPMTVEADGRSVRSKPYPIEVVKERSNRQSQGGARRFASDDVLLRMAVSKTEVYKGEPVVATVYLYGLDKVSSIAGATPPAFNGFWKQELSVAGAQPERVTFNGKVYDRVPIARYLLFPQKSGRLEVERMDVTAVVLVESPMTGPGSLLDEFMGLRGSMMEQREHRMTTSPVAVEVRELPSPAPENFTGAVGSFGISARLSSLSIKANSSATFTVTVSGTGNLPTVAEPKPAVPATFDLYPAKVGDDFSLASGGVSGSRTYSYPLIPRAEGRYTIEPVKFSYFDPVTARYHTVATDPVDVTVLPDDTGNSSGAVVGGIVKEDLAILGKDIHFIRLGDPKLSGRDSFFVWSPAYILVLAALAAAACGVLLYMRGRVRLMRDTVRVRNKRANKVALRRLRQSKAYMDSGKEALFYEETMRALYGYVSDKLDIPVSDLSKDNIEERMAGGGISQTDREAMIKLLSDCEWARYSPGASLQMTSVYQASLDIIDRFENKL